MKAIIHSCRPVLGHIPLCGCVLALAEMESMKQSTVWSKQELRGHSVDQKRLYLLEKWSYETASLSWFTSEGSRLCFNNLFYLHILAGICLFVPQVPETLMAMFHTYTGWIINTGLDLAPLRKSPRVQQCLNNTAAVTRQAAATHAPNTDEVSAEKRALGEATNAMFYSETQGAEIVSIGSFLLSVHCVLCSIIKKELLWHWLSAEVEGMKPLQPQETCASY